MSAQSADALIIRADASSRIGAGHLMRCLALAEAWNNADAEKVCITYCPSDNLRARANDAGAMPRSLAASWPDPRDLNALIRVIERYERPWVVLDGYHFDPEYHEAIRRIGARLLIIDDNAGTASYRADALLNSGLGADCLPYVCDNGTVRLFGPRYALLRPEFARAAGIARRFPASGSRVLITMGGADPTNVTARVIAELEYTGVPNLEVRVVVGAANANIAGVKAAAALLRDSHQIDILHNVSAMAEHMLWADVAVSAAGGSCWELAATGSASLLLVIAENQRPAAEAIDSRGAAEAIQDINSLAAGELGRRIGLLLENSELRRHRSELMRALVDGRGAERVAAALHSIDLESIDPESTASGNAAA